MGTEKIQDSPGTSAHFRVRKCSKINDEVYHKLTVTRLHEMATQDKYEPI